MPFVNARKRVKGLTPKPARSVEAAIRAVAAKGNKVRIADLSAECSECLLPDLSSFLNRPLLLLKHTLVGLLVRPAVVL